MKLEVNNLRRYFGSTRAVNGISFSLDGGQIMGFVGPNGAGKTTTLKILATLDEPTAGDVLIDGLSIVEEPEMARAAIGFVPDALPVHRDITVHEYLDFFARAYGIKGEKRERLIEELEEFTNLMGIREKMLNQLSKGMKQRVSLARALVHDPKVLLLDEPAAGLDPRARVELRELLRVLGSQGKAILISSHILVELAELCTSALIIEQGQLRRSGSLEELTTEELPTRKIIFRVMDRQQEALEQVMLMPHVQDVQAVGRDIQVTVDGGEEQCSALLATLIKQDFKVSEFRQLRTNLESVFMSVTKGDVQ